MKKIIILISTYNGAEFLETQLDSILLQTYSNIMIYIRDDGSDDDTVSIVEKYQKKNNNIILIKGENVGARNSFFKLISELPERADYYAFCDQDDYWYPEKIEKGIMELEKTEGVNIPLMYCSALQVTDEELNIIGRMNDIKNKRLIGFGNALVENINTGCTCIINDKLFEMLRMTKERYVNSILMHDWWIYLVASCFGQIIFDDNSYIKYRQHENNCIGAKYSITDKYKKKLRSFHKDIGRITEQIIVFDKIYHPKGENGQLLKDILDSKKHIKQRICLVSHNKVYRMRKIDNIIIKIKILFGWI